MGSVRLWTTLTQRVLYPLLAICCAEFFGSTSIDFAENQLSASLISLSLLPPTHLSILQHTRVRSFKKFYLFCHLVRGRSLAFGSLPSHFDDFFTLLRLRIGKDSLTHYAKGRLNFQLLLSSRIPFSFSLPFSGVFSSFLHSTFHCRTLKILELLRGVPLSEKVSSYLFGSKPGLIGLNLLGYVESWTKKDFVRHLFPFLG